MTKRLGKIGKLERRATHRDLTEDESRRILKRLRMFYQLQPHEMNEELKRSYEALYNDFNKRVQDRDASEDTITVARELLKLNRLSSLFIRLPTLEEFEDSEDMTIAAFYTYENTPREDLTGNMRKDRDVINFYLHSTKAMRELFFVRRWYREGDLRFTLEVLRNLKDLRLLARAEDLSRKLKRTFRKVAFLSSVSISINLWKASRPRLRFYRGQRSRRCRGDENRPYANLQIRLFFETDVEHLKYMMLLEEKEWRGTISIDETLHLRFLLKMFYDDDRGCRIYEGLEMRYQDIADRMDEGLTRYEYNLLLGDSLYLEYTQGISNTDNIVQRVERESRELLELYDASRDSPLFTGPIMDDSAILEFYLNSNPERRRWWAIARHHMLNNLRTIALTLSALERQDSNLYIEVLREHPHIDPSVVRLRGDWLSRIGVSGFRTLTEEERAVEEQAKRDREIDDGWGRFEIAVEVSEKEIEALEGVECSVCQESNVCSASDFTKCKHPICRECVANLRQSSCPMCRGQLTDEMESRVKRLYILEQDIGRRLRDASAEVTPVTIQLITDHMNRLYSGLANKMRQSVSYYHFINSVDSLIQEWIKSYKLTASNFRNKLKPGALLANTLIDMLIQFIEDLKAEAYDDIAEIIIYRIVEIDLPLPDEFSDVDVRVESFNPEHRFNLKHAIISNIKRRMPSFTNEVDNVDPRGPYLNHLKERAADTFISDILPSLSLEPTTQ